MRPLALAALLICIFIGTFMVMVALVGYSMMATRTLHDSSIPCIFPIAFVLAAAFVIIMVCKK